MTYLQWRRHATLWTALGRRAAWGLVTLALTGCERGCLAPRGDTPGQAPHQTAPTPGRGGASPGGSAPGSSGMAVDLEGSDCSGGLSRCVDGRLETSVTAHVPHPCRETERGGKCACPWENVGRCTTGCVKDGLEVVAEAEAARAQLCRPEVPVLRPLLPAESARVEICSEEAVSCIDGIVRACTSRGQPSRPVAACAFGCAAGVALDPGDLLTGDGPAPILCRRADAERR